MSKFFIFKKLGFFQKLCIGRKRPDSFYHVKVKRFCNLCAFLKFNILTEVFFFNNSFGLKNFTSCRYLK